jgi:hypothetical protein
MKKVFFFLSFVFSLSLSAQVPFIGDRLFISSNKLDSLWIKFTVDSIFIKANKTIHFNQPLYVNNVLVGSGGTTLTANMPISIETNTIKLDTAKHQKGVATFNDLLSKLSKTGDGSSLTGITYTQVGASPASTVSFPGFGTTGVLACVGNDARLSDSRPASDVSAWAKSGTKPSYTASEVGLSNVVNSKQLVNADTSSRKKVVTRIVTDSLYQAKGTLTLTGIQGGILYDTLVNTQKVANYLKWQEPSFGAEMFTSFATGNWTLTSGWESTNGSNTQLNHNAAGTGTATLLTVAPVIGVQYKVVIVVGAMTATAFTFTWGGVISSSVVTAGTYTTYVTATTTAGLLFTPTSASRFTITSISIKPYNPIGLTVNGNITGVSDRLTTNSGLTIIATLPTQSTSCVRGNNLNLYATNAIIGSSTNSTAIGGDVNIYSGYGTSLGGGNSSSGNINLIAAPSITNVNGGTISLISGNTGGGNLFLGYQFALASSYLYGNYVNSNAVPTLIIGSKHGNGRGTSVVIQGGNGTANPGDNVSITTGKSDVNQSTHSGNLSMTTADGGLITYTVSSGVAGNGGYFISTGGNGGAVIGNSAGQACIGGNGSTYTWTAGNGGNASGTGSSFTGGNAGTFQFIFGTGGTGSTANGNPSAFGINTTTPQSAFGTDMNTSLRLTGTQYFGGTTTSATDYSHSIVNSSGNLLIKPRIDATAAITFQNAAGSGNILTINTSVPGVEVGGTLIITTATPSSASDTGTTGQIAWDASYIYICTATNTWKRVAISTW